MSDSERAVGRFIQVDSRGRIVSTIETAEIAAGTMIDAGAFPAGHYLVALPGDPETQWYDGEKVVDRPENTAKVQGGQIVNVPAGSFVWLHGERHLCDDGTVEIDTDEPGYLRLLIQSFPEKDKVIELEIDT